MGFDAESARIALVHFGGDIQQAVDELLKSGGGVPQDWRDQQESGTSSSEGTSSSSGRSSGQGPHVNPYSYCKHEYEIFVAVKFCGFFFFQTFRGRKILQF